ncbi:hypothetical protein ABZ532_26505 [Streptomyces sp. NPDC019396]|uniref:hypothetical protein n=1 Tax=Streptomyces sp. NPDC019396 TaxID=3154687 RepID=UPI0033C5CC68
MRWLTLYARSRQVPASLAAVLATALVVWPLTRDGSAGHADPRLPALVIAAGAMAVSVGLGGQDPALDRTAAIRWAPRRAAHILLGGAVVGAALLAVQATGDDLATTAFVIRDSAGLMGLVAVGAVFWGARYAWSLPLIWLSYAIYAPPSAGAPTQTATWMLLPPGTDAGIWTALAITVAGTTAYAVAGPRR